MKHDVQSLTGGCFTYALQKTPIGAANKTIPALQRGFGVERCKAHSQILYPPLNGVQLRLTGMDEAGV